MQNSEIPRHKIKVHPPKINPIITSIGFGNPRYNSMLAYKENVLLSCGADLRVMDLKKNEVLFNQQIGSSQIFQVMSNGKYILVINFQGLISLLEFDSLKILHSFNANGKQVRHTAFTDKYLAVACELNEGTEKTCVNIYKIQEIQKKNYQPFKFIEGYYYYPEYKNDDLILIEYNDPNPKGKPRAETVLLEKLPITNKVVRFNQHFQIAASQQILEKGEIICAAQNNSTIYYLHTNKKLSIFSLISNQLKTIALESVQTPYLIEPFADSIVFVNANNQYTKLKYEFESKELKTEIIKINSLGIGGNLSVKFLENGIFLYNQNGLHLYSYTDHKTYTYGLFSITNCGIVFDEKAQKIAVADFGGSVYIFSCNRQRLTPQPLTSVFIGIPVRTIAWCKSTNKIVIGCVDGGFYVWDLINPQATLIQQYEHSINIIRAYDNKVYIGTSMGEIKIYEESTLKLIYEFKAHHPIQYQTQKQRQLFGSMKNYAQIWSLAISPSDKQHFSIISSSEDQSQKVFRMKQKQELQHHLKGHELAVTSIDWKYMNEKLGQLYVSCSDDKIVRFRDPNKQFQIIFEIETSTIKEWHTLTYLALEPQGHRVAIGSQNGYLFIYDILEKELLFGEKIHLGGIQGLDWVNGRICTCSSDLCINIIELK